MRTMIVLLLAFTGWVSAVEPPPMVPPPPITREELLGLIPNEVRPKGKKEWDAVSREAADQALKAAAGRTMRLKLRVHPVSQVPKSDTFLLSAFDYGYFGFRGRNYRTRARCRFATAEFPAVLKLKAGEDVRITGTIQSCTIEGQDSIALFLHDCSLDH